MERIIGTRKPSSMVEGDVFPTLVSRYPARFASAMVHIFNAVAKERRWPDDWKVETVTVIPKVPKPGGLGDCRNISCTNLMSKVMESLVLERLREELEVDPVQYLSLIHI